MLLFKADLRALRRERRRERRMAALGMPPPPTDTEFVFRDPEKRDLTREQLEETGGLLEPEQDRRRRRRRGLAALFRQETGSATGPTSVSDVKDGGLILPPELRGEADRKRRRKDALRGLFGADLAGLPPEVQQFAMAELAKMEVGDRLDPELLREVYRVAKAASVVVRTPDPREPSEERRDALQIKKFDDELQIVWGEVYIPNLPDSQGDYMTADEIRKAAYNFAAQGRLDQIDRMHDQDTDSCDAVAVETFIARKGDPVFIEGAWVIAVHVRDPEVWAAVKRGDFNGFSMEGAAVRTQKQFDLDLPDEIQGRTSSDNDHDHAFVVRFSDQGEFLGGETSADPDPTVSPPAIHSHSIQRGTVTERAGVAPHTHRYSISEAILELAIGRRPPDQPDEVDQTGFAA